ncbi:MULTISPECIES: phage tail sheath C-terminal domain-containing protein [unclassified Moraxella]|uniref:phage tail sheath C-terminal domain-containing protein n=1 Tax=unclassified Moraxella TaxID=2685852 RepID=UPI003AF956C9
MTHQILSPLGHSIIALSKPITDEKEANAWVEYLDFVSSATEQKDAILIVPFSDIDQATTFAQFAKVKACYRVVAVCYHGATGFEPELSAGIAGAISAELDPAVPFNGIKLPNLPVVTADKRLTRTRIEQALNKGVAVVALDAQDDPAIVRLISTYQVNEQGSPDDLLLDINGALILRYVRQDIRTAIMANPRRKNTEATRKDLRSQMLSRCLKLEQAEILQNVTNRQKELTVVQDTHDKTRANARIPADWVRGMHIVAVTLDVY